VRTLSLVVLSALLFLSGCDWPFESDDYRDQLAGVWEVTAPDTMSVGSAFEVVMLSSGTNGCWRKGRDVVRRADLQATILPYDQVFIGEGGCTTDVPTFTHVVSLETTTRGVFEVNVVTLLRATTGKDSVGAIQRTVVVQ
jgi:hypothetical protein